MIINCWDIKYWVSASYITGSVCHGAEPKSILMGVGSLPNSYSFFSLLWKKFACCFRRSFQYTFHINYEHLHLYHPQLDAPLRYEEKDFNKRRKATIKPRYCLQNSEKVIESDFFCQIANRYDVIQFDVKSKRLKLQNRACARFEGSLMQIPKPI